MKKDQRIALVLSILFIGLFIISSCNKDDEATGTDKELYEMAKVTTGFTWYKFSDAKLDRSAASGHPQPFLRTRYNSVAATQLDSIGKIKTDAVFPEGSLVVKELFDNSTTIGRYAVLYKNSSNEDADANGWVWGYIDADGSVAEPASKKGSGCSGCHSQAGNIEYMLMNVYFP